LIGGINLYGVITSSVILSTDTVVSHVYTPRFATLALVKSIGGLISGIWHFILWIRLLFWGHT